jgi:hypothetical protein
MRSSITKLSAVVIFFGCCTSAVYAEEVFPRSPYLFPNTAVWREITGRTLDGTWPFHDPMPVVFSDRTVYRNSQKIRDIDSILTFWHYPADELELRDDGFYYVRVDDALFAVIFGGGFYADACVSGEQGGKADLANEIPQWIDPLARREALLSRDAGGRESIHAGTSFWVMEDGIAGISVPSSLSETVRGQKITYGPERMRSPFAAWGEFNVVYHNSVLAWVEDEPGAGSGVKIAVEFTAPRDHLLVLNGFVDLERRHLYKMNARMKSVLIRGDDFSINHTFADEVRFQRVEFPATTGSVVLEVKTVYPGSRWEDMAVTALFCEVSPENIEKEKVREVTERWVHQAEWIKRAFEDRKGR